MTDEQPIENAPQEEREDTHAIDWIALLPDLWNSKKLIAIVTGSATVLAVIVSLLLPKYFKSTATILPQTDKGALARLAGLSDLASAAGITVGGEVPLTQLYPHDYYSRSNVIER